VPEPLTSHSSKEGSTELQAYSYTDTAHTWNPLFRSPFGFQRGTRKHDGATLGSAATVAADEASGLTLARVRKASHIGAEVNHYGHSERERER
jgi:hypothetical protein